MGIVHFVRNAKQGTQFSVRGKSYRVVSEQVAEHPDLIVYACQRMKLGEPVRGTVDVTLRFGRDRVEVYGW